MEARLGDAMACAQGRLRDVGQGPDRLGEALGPHHPRPRLGAAGRLQLRTLPRPERAKDLEVEGQRAHHRRMAALRFAREPVALHVPEAFGREAPLLRRHPARGRRLSVVPRRLRAAGPEGAARQPGLARPRRGAARARAPRRGGTSAERESGTAVSFAMLLNLAAVANSEDPGVLWGFLRRYAPGVSPETHPRLDR